MGNVRITKLEVKEIGPFGDLVLQFPDKPSNMEGKAEIHILTGENGTGKTTVLELLIGAIVANPRLGTKYRNHDQSTKFSVWFNTPDHSAKYFGGDEFESITFLGSGEVSGKVSILKKYRTSVSNGTGFSTAFFAYSGYRKIEHKQIIGVSEITKQPMEGALDLATPRDPLVFLQWVLNLKTKAAISFAQDKRQIAIQYEEAITNIEKTIKEITGISIRFEVETEPYDVKVSIDGTVIHFSNLPDGLKSIISWIADLLMRMDRVKWEHDTPVFERNFILFLDEIEVHMHPAWQRKILPAVQSLFPNAQIFISTHSPFVVGSVDGAWIHKFVKPNGDSQLAEGYPLLSEDAKSFRYWLSEVFDIASEYGMEADKQLHHFYELRNAVLKGANGTTQSALVQAGQGLAEQSHELRQIIEMELRQVNRRMALDLSL